MPLLRLLVCLVLGTPWQVGAQVGAPNFGDFPTPLSRQMDTRDLPGDGPAWRIERRQSAPDADQLEERLAMLRPSGVDQLLARNKLLEAIKQAKRDCPACMTVLEAESGSLGAAPGQLGRCKDTVAKCPPGRPYVNSATGVCTSVADIKALP